MFNNFPDFSGCLRTAILYAVAIALVGLGVGILIGRSW